MSDTDLHSDSSVPSSAEFAARQTLANGAVPPPPPASKPPPAPSTGKLDDMPVATPIKKTNSPPPAPKPPSRKPAAPAKQPVAKIPKQPAVKVAKQPIPQQSIPQQPVATPVRPASHLDPKKVAVPPPPPPRSTLPPLRPGPDLTKVASGVGSAKGVRWRGELQSIERHASQVKEAKQAKRAAGILASPEAPPPTELVGDQELEDDKLIREMPSWLVSTVVHLVLLLILALFSTDVGGGVKNMILEFGYSEEKAQVELAEFSIDAPEDVVEVDTLSDLETEEPTPEIFDAPELTETIELTPLDLGSEASVAVEIVKPMFNGRTGAMRKALLAIYGGTKETEDAVKLGLAWLKKNQKRNGSWSMQGPYDDGALTENPCAATSMALLAFLGDGNTHMSGEYKDVVDKGIRYLVGLQDRSGLVAGKSRGHEKMYSQAQATIVLCELYGMTKDSWLRPRAQLALDFAMDAQSDEGGWRYQPKFDADTSVTGWFVMALKSGEAAGLEVHTPVWAGIDDFLTSVQSYEGAAYAYQPGRGPSPAMTAEGLLCRQYLGWQRDEPALKRGAMALVDGSPFNMRDRDVYYWYYATQVLHHYGGSPWRVWNDEMREQLPKAQVKSGKEAGSWAPQQDSWGRNSGRLYTTCLSLYCMEVYYRHMPLYKEGHAGQD